MKLSEALQEVLNSGPNPEYRLWRHRLKKGTLRIGTQEEILKAHGFVKEEESHWKKRK
jgi:hypothetical protein